MKDKTARFMAFLLYFIIGSICLVGAFLKWTIDYSTQYVLFFMIFMNIAFGFLYFNKKSSVEEE